MMIIMNDFQGLRRSFMRNRMWDEDSDLPVCAENGAGGEVAFALDEKRKKRGRWILPILCLLLSLCILVVAIVLVGQRDLESQVTEAVPKTEKEKIVFVREWDEDSGILSTPEIYTRCSESVVTISVYKEGQLRRGLGFLIREDGYIATDSTLVKGGDRFAVRLADGREYAAECVGSEDFCEVGLLKIEERGLQGVTFGRSEALLVGERVVAVGDRSACTGEIASLSNSIPIRDEDGRLVKKLRGIRVSAPSLAEYGGAPLLNEYGEVIGMFSVRSDGAGHILPSDVLTEILDAMTAGEQIPEESLLKGATPAPILGAVGAAASEDGVVGVRIHRFLSGLCSAASILREGDLILSVDGIAVRSVEEIARAIEEKNPGDAVSVTVLRFEQTLTFEVLLSGRDS